MQEKPKPSAILLTFFPFVAIAFQLNSFFKGDFSIASAVLIISCLGVMACGIISLVKLKREQRL